VLLLSCSGRVRSDVRRAQVKVCASAVADLQKKHGEQLMTFAVQQQQQQQHQQQQQQSLAACQTVNQKAGHIPAAAQQSANGTPTEIW
jgi:hypothetical protein